MKVILSSIFYAATHDPLTNDCICTGGVVHSFIITYHYSTERSALSNYNCPSHSSHSLSMQSGASGVKETENHRVEKFSYIWEMKLGNTSQQTLICVKKKDWRHWLLCNHKAEMLVRWAAYVYQDSHTKLSHLFCYLLLRLFHYFIMWM